MGMVVLFLVYGLVMLQGANNILWLVVWPITRFLAVLLQAKVRTTDNNHMQGKSTKPVPSDNWPAFVVATFITLISSAYLFNMFMELVR